jgi:hypothetical protein
MRSPLTGQCLCGAVRFDTQPEDFGQLIALGRNRTRSGERKR